MAMLPGAPPPKKKGAKVFQVRGKKIVAMAPGQTEGVDIDDPEMAVQVNPGDLLDHGDGSPPVDIHRAFHHNPKMLPTKLHKHLTEAARRHHAIQHVHQAAGMEPVAPPPGSAPPMPMNRLPGSGMAA